MIKGQGKLRKIDGHLIKNELDDALAKLPDCENFKFLIVDDKPNRVLPQLTYLFSVLLKAISDQDENHPSTSALYRYFEEKFAPPHTSTIQGVEYEYFDLKREKAVDVGNFIERVAEYAQDEWGMEVPDIKELKTPEENECYSKAYLMQEIDWRRFISSKTKH